MKPIQAALLLLLTVTFVVSPLAAQEELGVDSAIAMGKPKGTPLEGTDLEQRTEELSSLMRCPVCQGLSIADSPTLLAQAMKSEVRQSLAAGYTETQIFDYFEQSYGEFVRLEPKAKGFNLVVWIAPGAALLMGLALIVYRLRSSKRESIPVEDKSPVDDLDSYRQRVRNEVNS
jgi:cytochrome c-type biogenesis protein CcmH